MANEVSIPCHIEKNKFHNSHHSFVEYFSQFEEGKLNFLSIKAKDCVEQNLHL